MTRPTELEVLNAERDKAWDAALEAAVRASWDAAYCAPQDIEAKIRALKRGEREMNNRCCNNDCNQGRDCPHREHKPQWVNRRGRLWTPVERVFNGAKSLQKRVGFSKVTLPKPPWDND